MQSANPWHWIIEHPLLSSAEKLVALVILRHQNSNQKCWPSIQRIAQLARFGTRYTQRVLHGLYQKGILNVERRLGHSNCYSIRQRQLLLGLRSAKTYTPAPQATPGPEDPPLAGHPLLNPSQIVT
ncbi:hypothetical protein LCGC14_3154230 [marine sediment metagenome]|uniref:Helix-turn-helix domain-containing protein n=1 Tax=marine sediment metagenome TaxID=412755 RepID=A0A0F8VT50_9ZZZZ